ncbi:MAG TPA: hypothetical protein VLK65_12055 [Vicinamibacteria bacterium]|nr:hypothetical protein [Vicinamibacteria bacterium]
MKSFTLSAVVILATIGSSALATPRFEPPKKAIDPFRVFFKASPEESTDDERAQIEEARIELAKRLDENKKWFRVMSAQEEAEILIDLTNYWTREERRVLSTWGVVPPTEGGQPNKTQMVEIVTFHVLEARVELFGAERMLRGERVRNEGGKAKDAVKDLVRRIEELCRDEYDYSMRRRANARGER